MQIIENLLFLITLIALGKFFSYVETLGLPMIMTTKVNVWEFHLSLSPIRFDIKQ